MNFVRPVRSWLLFADTMWHACGASAVRHTNRRKRPGVGLSECGAVVLVFLKALVFFSWPDLVSSVHQLICFLYWGCFYLLLYALWTFNRLDYLMPQKKLTSLHWLPPTFILIRADKRPLKLSTEIHKHEHEAQGQFELKVSLLIFAIIMLNSEV